MRYIGITRYCAGCGIPMGVTRRVRIIRCPQCKKDDVRKEKRAALASKVLDRIPGKLTHKLVMDVLLTIEQIRKGQIADLHRKKAGRS